VRGNTKARLVRTAAAVLACAATGHALAAGAATRWPVRHATSHAQCPLRFAEGPFAKVLGSRGQWASLTPVPEDKALAEPVDWRRQQVVVFGLGTRPSLGHKVEVGSPALRLRGKTAYLDVKVSRPQPGQVAASALSRPCVLAVVDRRAWRELVVRDVDEPGRTLWRGRVAPAAR
jgi:hypothetical protein